MHEPLIPENSRTSTSCAEGFPARHITSDAQVYKQAGNGVTVNVVETIPYIWVDRGKPEWYVYKPTTQDMDRLRESCKSYLDVFREPVVPISKRTAKKAKSTRNDPAR